MKRIGILGAAGLFASAILAGAAQAETVLRISSWASPKHGINATVWPTWGKMVEEATEGRVKTKIEYNLGSPIAQMDLIRDGVADVMWTFHGYNPGRFFLTQAVEMPGLNASAEAASVAYWRVYEKHLAGKNIHQGVKVIGLTTHGPGVIHTRKPLKNISDLKGMKVRVGGGIGGEVGKKLGIVGVRVPAPKVYETVAQGVAEGVFMPMETKVSFKLKEVAPYSLIMPGGLYYGSFVFAMNPDKFNSLSKKDQDAIMSVSGEVLSKVAGQMWDKVDASGLEDAKKAGNTITIADAATKAAFDKLAAQIEQEWIAKAAKKKVDGAKVLADLRKIARDYDAAKK